LQLHEHGGANESCAKTLRNSSGGSSIVSLDGGRKADFTSGNQLWDACQADEGKEPVKEMFCTVYLLGAGETFQAL